MAGLSALERIPGEIRLLIYGLLFDDRNTKTLEFRNEPPNEYKKRKHVRSSYNVLGKDLLRQSTPTTYHLITPVEFHPAIMLSSRKIYEETAHFLYDTHTFGFGRDVEAIVPFFKDLRPNTRPLICEISLIKQGFVYSRDYDRCEWNEMCRYVQGNMQIRRLQLVIEGGRPTLGWEGFPVFDASDFRALYKARHEPLEWVWELLSIEGIRNVEIGTEIHPCPPSHSNAMAFFAAFSASLEKGFSDFLKSELTSGSSAQAGECNLLI